MTTTKTCLKFHHQKATHALLNLLCATLRWHDLSMNADNMKNTLLKTTTLLAVLFTTGPASGSGDFLVKVGDSWAGRLQAIQLLESTQMKIDVISDEWIRVESPNLEVLEAELAPLMTNGDVVEIQPNYKLKLIQPIQWEDPLRRQAVWNGLFDRGMLYDPTNPPADNPAIPAAPKLQQGADPLLKNQWGHRVVGAVEAWRTAPMKNAITVAVIDTGVDYTHEDLLPSMWRNPGETGLDAKKKDKSTNGVDDDGNGYVDDVVGWDFASNDRLPYDLTLKRADIVFKGGNPGHGTHCAGTIAARGSNKLGISGVAPKAQIMALRFLTENGIGTTADAVKAVRYAVKNGAKVINSSWGSEGEDKEHPADNKALHDAVAYAESKGVIFVAAAGNGHSGEAYDNDNDPLPAYPASYPHDIIISVTAVDSNGNLGSFANWGAKSVDLAAPGLAVYSTMVSNHYSQNIISMDGWDVPWDGTSMAAPYVSGAVAYYWANNPHLNWKQVKQTILKSVSPLPSVRGKTVSGGQLDMRRL